MNSNKYKAKKSKSKVKVRVTKCIVCVGRPLKSHYVRTMMIFLYLARPRPWPSPVYDLYTLFLTFSQFVSHNKHNFMRVIVNSEENMTKGSLNHSHYLGKYPNFRVPSWDIQVHSTFPYKFINGSLFLPWIKAILSLFLFFFFRESLSSFFIV